jgi:hypothetical protein
MNPYHEAERIELHAGTPRLRKELHGFLKDRGFRSIDDFYVLPRRGRVMPWQSQDIVVLDVRLAGNAVYEAREDIAEGTAGAWDCLQLKYPMASVPSECLSVFVSHAAALASHFDLAIRYQDHEMPLDDVARELASIADHLSENWFDPGSENLALLILDEYPRR